MNNKTSIIKQIENILGYKIVLEKKHMKNYMQKEQSYAYKIYRMKLCIVSFHLIPMPGCCGVVVSTSAYLHPTLRKKGLGTLLNQLRINLAEDLGYSEIICTCLKNNIPQVKILEKNGWSRRSEFNNSRTYNDILIYTYTI